MTKGGVIKAPCSKYWLQGARERPTPAARFDVSDRIQTEDASGSGYFRSMRTRQTSGPEASYVHSNPFGRSAASW